MNHTISSPTSSSRASGSGSSIPTTPKTNGNHQRGGQRAPNGRQRKAQSSSPQALNPFASSSICSSPSARNVPLPPIEWLNKLQVPSDETPSRPSSSISDTSSSTSSLASVSSGGHPSSPSSPLSHFQLEKSTEMGGIRVCPLQLIAAIVSA
uniref:Uncharacterized protein n=1 Tax=Caenorhabditis tropicalis TaxID=1561998 RepID=A0A1I7U5L3_9PELO